jgi:hypothetical protein
MGTLDYTAKSQDGAPHGVARMIQARQVVGTAPDTGNGGDGDVFGTQEETGNNARSYELSALIREGTLIKTWLPVDLPALCRMIVAALVSPNPLGSCAALARLAASLPAGTALGAQACSVWRFISAAMR